MLLMPEIIAQHAARTPEKPAYIYKDEVITYAQLNDRVLKCAAGLAHLGVKKGSTFGLMLRNSPEFVILTMALSKLGGVAVPINFLEKAERVALILKDAGAMGILTSKEFLKTVRAAAKDVPSVQHVVVRDESDGTTIAFNRLYEHGHWTEPTTTQLDDLMILLYTSGTTGLPKGVMLSHRNFLANVDQCMAAIELKPTDRFLCLLPMFHSFSWTTCVLLPLKLGTVSVIIESLLPFDPVIQAIWKHKVTLFVGVPQIFSALASKIKGAKAFVIRLFNPVRVCISGAAPMPPGVHKSFEKSVGVKLLEGYGLTEAAPVVSMNPISQRKIGTVGKPLPGVAVELRDDEGHVVPSGAVGEIWVKGENVMRGYYNKPKETAEVLTTDGWLKTGDMAKFDADGFLTIVDRKKDLIIIKGLNVYPQEVENVILRVPGVREAAVVGKLDPETGDELIRAFVSPQPGIIIDKQAVMAACREHLAPYKRPKDVIVMDELPKNALQKILKKDLRQL